MMPFNAREYWESRLGDNFGLGGVGRLNWGTRYNRWAYRVRRRVFIRLVRSLNLDFGSVRVLDIGAGTGFYVDCWQDLGVRSLTGIDLTDVAVNGLGKKYPESAFYRVDIGNDISAIQGTRYDVISCMDVLFHIVEHRSYQKALENVYSLLRPGGFFVFTEAFAHESASCSRHVVHRGEHEIITILQRVGFRIVRRGPFLVLMNAPVDPQRRLLRMYWRTLQGVVQGVPFGGAVAGAILYPIELALVSLLSRSPSTNIVLCQRPTGDAG